MIFPLKEEAPRSLRLTVRKMTWLPVVLLYGMTAAVLLCLGVMTVFYGYWLIEKNSSQYRRQMNAAAYSTQIFFDQREQLLRATAASVVPNLKKLSASEMPSRLGSSQQIRLFPLRDGADRFQWSLVLMPRAFEALEQAQVELVYTSMDTGTTQVVLRDERPSSFTLSEQTQRWIHDRLSAQTGQLRPGEAAPVVWLTPPGTTVKKLFMYLPLDASDPQAGWALPFLILLPGWIFLICMAAALRCMRPMASPLCSVQARHSLLIWISLKKMALHPSLGTRIWSALC